jgi:RNAse (barnase) inhibitor barstar
MFDICDYCADNLQALWAISSGRFTFHMYSSLSELYCLRETVDKMIQELEQIKKEKDEKSKELRKKK